MEDKDPKYYRAHAVVYYSISDCTTVVAEKDVYSRQTQKELEQIRKDYKKKIKEAYKRIYGE